MGNSANLYTSQTILNRCFDAANNRLSTSGGGSSGSVTVIETQTGAYALLSTDYFVPASGNFAVTLPAATGTGKVYVVKNVGTGTITLTPTGADTIDGETTIPMTTQYESVEVVDAASASWLII